MTGLSRADQIAVLRGFLRGDIPFEAFRTRVAEHVQFAFDARVREARFLIPLDVSVVITPADLIPMLRRFLAWECTEEDIETWATVVRMVDAFDVPPDLSETEADDLLDPMWNVLELLSNLTVIKSPARERVEAAVTDLEAAQARLDARAV
ncbi:MAG TPA: hypothetical protein VJ650_03510 [Gemmatimonadaceae bacterium]|nr:hypothetical protein [Gemmatimonadaceae bacterium]